MSPLNSPNSQNISNSPNLQADTQDDDEIDLLSLLDVVIESRWLIISIAFLVFLLCGTYAYLSRPVFEANSLIQVEDSKSSTIGALGEAASLLDAKSTASAEMEILRSRLVLGQTVDELQLNLSATPVYLPIVGSRLARYATELSTPGIFGFGGYVSGTESIKVSQLDVPTSLEGIALRLVVVDKGYQLFDPNGKLITSGQVGIAVLFDTAGGPGNIFVSSLSAKPGAFFTLVKGSRLNAIEGLQADLKIEEKGKQSGVIGVTLQGTNPERIATILNTVGKVYVNQNIDRKAAEADKSLVFLDDFLPQLKRQLETSEGKFTAFRNQNRTINLSAEADLILQQAVALQTNLMTLQQKRKELEALFTSQHPSIKTIDAQIAAVSNEINTNNKTVRTLPNLEQDSLRLIRDVKVNNELYTALLTNTQQLRLVKEGTVGNVRVVDVSAVPENPVAPKRSLILGTSAVLGLLLGIGIAFLRNSLRPGIKDASDIETATGLNVFATVPFSNEQQKLYKLINDRLPGNHVLAVSNPEDPSIESLRGLRTALQFAMLDAANNILLVSGPTPNIGKSFTSVNFAAVLGAGNKRVLLIDADLRKGHIHNYFGQERGFGLSELITGSQTLETVIRKNVAPNVDLICTGTLPPNPGELLMSPTTDVLLKTLSAQYDLVMIDTPPVLAVSDTQVLAHLVGTIFLIARADVSTLGELQESTKRLSQAGAQVKGVVFNGFNTSRQRYGGYGYKYSRYRYTQYQYGK
ncbi:Tyrosine-protein kinase ptk [Polaromonas vacuolata]|uniref:Putative tyrosine-protein kinase EpsB n=1 Tax=Polaromonas vacuolata TaxID=37448 RepID=A0A6H2H7J3_9BURK|nr:polysaccharide biosynthesis tyrosine autokinase [Polaromonas vacuolata]QJC55763.1 Tyrosine-protein kinase ptk [Polaromonas vacuolata]